MQSRSLVPPMPRDVSCERFVPGRNWTPSSARLATILRSLMCMMRWMLRSEENKEFVAGPADVARADGHDGVARACLPQKKLDALLHGAKIVDVLVTRVANGMGERFAAHARDGRLAGGIDIGQHENIGLIEGAAELAPKMLRACKTMRLKKHQEPIEFAATRRFQSR